MIEINRIKWFELSLTGQEISTRLGFSEPETGEFLCCNEVYDMVWNALKKCWKIWELDRTPHYCEVDYAWKGKEPPLPFVSPKNWMPILTDTKNKINEFYKNNLGRYPEAPEIEGAYRNCFINPNFVYNFDVKPSVKNIDDKDLYFKENVKTKEREDLDEIEFSEYVEIGKCCFCGDPIYVYDPDIYVDAGEIEMSFGYGSGRDTSYGKGYIHDLCSAKLDQQVFKKRLKWNHEYSTIDIEKTEKENKLKYLKSERDK